MRDAQRRRRARCWRGARRRSGSRRRRWLGCGRNRLGFGAAVGERGNQDHRTERAADAGPEVLPARPVWRRVETHAHDRRTPPTRVWPDRRPRPSAPWPFRSVATRTVIHSDRGSPPGRRTQRTHGRRRGALVGDVRQHDHRYPRQCERQQDSSAAPLVLHPERPTERRRTPRRVWTPTGRRAPSRGRSRPVGRRVESHFHEPQLPPREPVSMVDPPYGKRFAFTQSALRTWRVHKPRADDRRRCAVL